MKPERAQLLDVIESVADGGELDWDKLEGGLKDEQDRRLFAQLKILARIAEVHRSQADEPEDHIVPARTLNPKVIGEIQPLRPLDDSSEGDAAADAPPALEAVSPAGGAGERPMSAFMQTLGLPANEANTPLPVEPVSSRSAPLAPSWADAAAAAPSSGRASRMWGHLELIARIGEGTFGEVYRARDTKLQRDVAVKLLRVGNGPEDPQAETVLREARILARVSHPNVVLVHGAETVDGRVGLWMELIRGATLEELVQSHGPYSAREATVIGQDLCRALAAVHGAGLVHRDIKAQNVMREEGGRLVLMDFGAGQLLGGPSPGRDGRITGTPLYLAPEVLAGSEATVRSDIYSLGVLLYHLVTASYPLRARSVEELREAHRAGRRIRLHDARPDLQGSLVDVIERALAAHPADRFGSAGEMQSALTLALGVGVASGSIVQARETIEPFIPPGSARMPRRDGSTIGLRPGWKLICAICVLALVAGATGAWLLKSTGWRPFVTASPRLARQTIAVLPIQSASGSADPLFIEVQDSLISALGRISSLRSISRTSVMRYASGGKLMPEIGRELNADYIVETTASHEGDRVRMTARLIRAGDDTQLWSATIERPLTEVLKMGGVALDIASTIGVNATAEERNGLVQEYTPNPAAQAAYLEGRYQLARGNLEGTRSARALLERAVSLDPKYARAYASLATCYTRLRVFGLSDDEARPLALDASRRAIEADDRLADAHTQRAFSLFMFNRDWQGADSEFRRAVELNPSEVEVRTSYANFLLARGDLAEAKRHIRVAREAAPLSGDVWGADGLSHYYSREFDEAEVSYRRGLELAPFFGRYVGLGRVLTEKRDCTGAVQALEQAARSTKAPAPRAELARTYAACGHTEEARRLLGELESDLGRDGVPHLSPQHRAYVYAALGDKDRAMEFLMQAVAEQQPDIMWAKVDPRLDSLRGDPRFRTYLTALGIEP